MTFGSVFAGVGGIDLGLERVGMTCRWQVENDQYASQVLAQHWPGVPNLGDITGVDWNDVEPVDLICGGFPCTDISLAGKGAGMGEGTRSGLWSFYADAIRILRPRYVFVENVGALAVRGLTRVLGDLAALGFDAEWATVRASDVGAPHRRERIFIVATDTDSLGLDGGTQLDRETPRGLERTHRRHTNGRRMEDTRRPDMGVYEAAVRRWEQLIRPAPSPTDDRGRLSPDFVEWMMGFPQDWTAGIPRAERLKCLGNAVVPRCAVAAWSELAGEQLVAA